MMCSFSRLPDAEAQYMNLPTDLRCNTLSCHETLGALHDLAETRLPQSQQEYK
jgi:hypothetical protein